MDITVLFLHTFYSVLIFYTVRVHCTVQQVCTISVAVVRHNDQSRTIFPVYNQQTSKKEIIEPFITNNVKKYSTCLYKSNVLHALDLVYM